MKSPYSPRDKETRVHQTVIGDSNIVTGTGDIYFVEQLPPLANTKDRLQLSLLMSKVREFWIESVLKTALPSDLVLDLKRKPENSMVENPWERTLVLPKGDQPENVKGRTQIDIFSSSGRALLILGEPGAGKTISLLQLTEELLALCQEDASFSLPIPVVLNLSSWTASSGSLEEWIASDMAAKYHVPRRLGQSWLDSSRIIPILDGLDEVQERQRSKCVSAINSFIETAGLPGIAVASRREEYIASGIKLRFGGAIYVQPPSDEQVYDYLDRFDAGNIAAQLRESPDLLSLAKSPLMLNVMVTAFKEGLDEKHIALKPDRHGILSAYIQRTLDRSEYFMRSNDGESVLKVLSWLAKGMRDNNRSEFLIEELQPSWLAQSRARLLYLFVSRVSASFIAVSIFMVPLMLTVDFGGEKEYGMYEMPSITAIEFVAFYFAIVLLTGSCVFVLDALRRVVLKDSWDKRSPTQVGAFAVVTVVALALLFFQFDTPGCFALAASIPLGLFLGARSARRDDRSDIVTAEGLTWSWKSALRGGVRGLVFGALLGTLIAAIFLIALASSNELGATLLSLAAALLAGVLSGIAAGICGVVFGGLDRTFTRTKTLPNQGIILTVKSACLAGLSAFIIAGVLSVVSSNILQRTLGTSDSFDFDWQTFLLFAVPVSSFAAIWHGAIDVLHHFLLRAILALSTDAPFPIARQLDKAVRATLLRRVGPGYIFLHRTVLEHFSAVDVSREFAR